MNTGRRVEHAKPWRGCQACKQRNIRCDEGRPVCCNCIKHRRACEHAPPSDTKGLRSPPADHVLPDTRPLLRNQAHGVSSINHASASDTTAASASIPSSLDPYPQSLLPLTPGRRALLAFCKEHNIPFLVHPGPTGSLQADWFALKTPRR